MTTTGKFIRSTFVAMTTMLLLTACGSSGDDNFDDRTGLAEPKMRVVHAVPAGPAVSLFRNGEPNTLISNIDYKGASQYQEIARGSATFTIRGGPGNPELANTAIDAQRSHRYSLVALPGSGVVDLLAIDDPFNKSLVSDNARVRVVNASSNARNLDVYLTPPATDLGTVAPTIAAVGYKEARPASGSDSVEVEGATYRLRITEAGTKNPIFDADVTVPRNGDWLLVTLPDQILSVLAPNDIRVLVVRADDNPDATDEIESR